MKFKTVAILSLISLSAFAEIIVTDVKFDKKDLNSKMVIEYSGEMAEVPNWDVAGKTFIMTVPAAKLKAPLNKKVGQGAFLRATSLENGKIKITVNFAQDLQKKKDLISLSIQDGALEVILPKIETTTLVNTAPVKTETVLDEAYLNNLVKEVSPVENKKVEIKDEIILRKSAVKKPVEESATKKSFSLSAVAIKLLGFLGVVLGLFYGVVTLFKKGVVTKGKLGFLNNTDLVQVLNTTHLGNKKSIILVKVHQQAFLLSNTEKDLQFLAEVQNLPGLIKEGEKQVAGDNFDTNFQLIENSEGIEDRIVLKENIHESSADELPSNSLVRFSDQLKSKMKGLRPL